MPDMTRCEALLQIIRQAVINTANRPPGRRGPFVFDEAELQSLATTLAKGLLT